MSQDYTVAKELASLKEIKQSAEQRISDLSLNALNYVNDHRLHKTGGGGTGGGVLNLHMNRQTRALDKTYAEIESVFGNTIIFMDSTALLIGTEENEDGYFVYFADFYDAPTVAKITFKADTKNDYPVAQMG